MQEDTIPAQDLTLALLGAGAVTPVADQGAGIAGAGALLPQTAAVGVEAMKIVSSVLLADHIRSHILVLAPGHLVRIVRRVTSQVIK